jgi:hypothetical protein
MVQTKPLAFTITPLVQRATLDPGGNFEPGADLEARLGCSSGSILPDSTRAFMEPRFGVDLSGVRLHTGSEAAKLNRNISAQAFTHGRDIYLGAGMNDLESSTGKQLLAHELTHTIQQSTVESAGPTAVLDQNQQTYGNHAVQRQPAGPTPTATDAVPPVAAPGSAVAATSGAIGVPTTGHQVEASIMLPAGQSLKMVSGSPPKEIHTKADVRVRVLATAGGISVSFSSGMVISTRNPEAYIPEVDIQVDEIGWSYGTSTQQLRVTWTARNIVNWIGSPGGDILAAMSAQWATLPARMQKPGYDPFSDPSLPGDLITFARSLATTGGGSSAPKVLAREVEAWFVLSDEFSRDAGSGAKVVIPKGSRISLLAFLNGDLTASPPVIKVTSITLGVPAQGPASVNLRAMGQDWPVVAVSNVRVAYGGHITVDYRILHEDLGSDLLEILAAAVVQENPLNAGRIREDLTVKDAAAHKLVDKMVSGKLEPMFADIIRANAGALPGINLLDVFGIPAAPGGAGR